MGSGPLEPPAPERGDQQQANWAKDQAGHKGDALTEMCRTFWAVKNGDLPRADGVRDVAMLDKIHNGMPEHDASSASSTFTACRADFSEREQDRAAAAW